MSGETRKTKHAEEFNSPFYIFCYSQSFLYKSSNNEDCRVYVVLSNSLLANIGFCTRHSVYMSYVRSENPLRQLTLHQIVPGGHNKMRLWCSIHHHIRLADERGAIWIRIKMQQEDVCHVCFWDVCACSKKYLTQWQLKIIINSTQYPSRDLHFIVLLIILRTEVSFIRISRTIYILASSCIYKRLQRNGHSHSSNKTAWLEQDSIEPTMYVVKKIIKRTSNSPFSVAHEIIIFYSTLWTLSATHITAYNNHYTTHMHSCSSKVKI